MYNQAKPICEAAHEVDAVVIADCVTSLGGMPVLMDENGIDIAYSCTQKGLGCPPGLSPMTVSPRALDRLKARKTPVQSWYLDLAAARWLLYRPQVSPHRVGYAVLCAARRAWRWWPRKAARTVGSGITAIIRRSWRASRLWDSACTSQNAGRPVVDAEHAPRPAGIDDAKVRQYLLASAASRSRGASAHSPARCSASA